MNPGAPVFDTLRPSDFDALHAIVSDWDVVRMLESWPWPPEPEFTRSRTTAYPGEGFVWAIRVTGQLAGTCGITEGSLGYMVADAFRGRGIATHAVRAAVSHAFAAYPLDQITADVWSDNPASMRVLTKTGFEETGRGRVLVHARNAEVGVAKFVLTRQTWSLRADGGSATAPGGKAII